MGDKHCVPATLAAQWLAAGPLLYDVVPRAGHRLLVLGVDAHVASGLDGGAGLDRVHVRAAVESCHHVLCAQAATSTRPDADLARLCRPTTGHALGAIDLGLGAVGCTASAAHGRQRLLCRLANHLLHLPGRHHALDADGQLLCPPCVRRPCHGLVDVVVFCCLCDWRSAVCLWRIEARMSVSLRLTIKVVVHPQHL